MSLNRNQRVAVWAGLLLFLATGIYPPWVYAHVYVDSSAVTEAGIGENGDHPAVATALALTTLEKPAGYGWIFYPPELSHYSKLSRSEFQGGRLDLVRPLVEWVILLVATGASVYGLADQRRPTNSRADVAPTSQNGARG